MSLLLSWNSERLFKSYGSFHYKIPHVTETITSNQALFLISSMALGSLRDTCNAFHIGHGKTQGGGEEKGARPATFLAAPPQ